MIWHIGLLALSAAALIGMAPAAAQQGGQLTFRGIVQNGQFGPVASGAAISAVNSLTGTTCGQGFVGLGSAYNVAISPSADCATSGTSLAFLINGIQAVPTTLVTSSSGTFSMNLNVNGALPAGPTATTWYSGTIVSGTGQPIAAGSPVGAFSAVTNAACGQTTVGPAGSYTILITPAPPCNAVGSLLAFSVGGFSASPSATVSGTGGSQSLNLAIAGSTLTSTSSPLIYSGTIFPGPLQMSGAGSQIAAVAQGTATPCGTAIVGPSGVYSLSIVDSPVCTAAGTMLAFTVNGVLANPTATVPSSAGVVSLNLSLGGPAPQSAPPPGGTRIQPTALTFGCNLVVAAFGSNATPQQLLAAAANPSAVVSIWRFDNTQQRYQGFFPSPGVPSDLQSFSALDALFICVNAATTINLPQPITAPGS